MKLSSLLLLLAPALVGQPAFQSKSTSSIDLSVKGDEKTIQITNVEYEMASEPWLVLRKTVQSKQVIGDIGSEATVKVEAWPLASAMKTKPVYSLTVSGSSVKTLNQELLQVSRGLEWWSLYNVRTGAHLFDSYVQPLAFSISRETVTLRYLGLEAPPDDAKDARLKAPNVVAVVTYASADRVIREALLTCADPKRAAMLRSYADSTRTIAPAGPDAVPTGVRIAISQQFPSAPATVTVQIPIAKDDLDLVHATLPAGLKIAFWKR